MVGSEICLIRPVFAEVFDLSWRVRELKLVQAGRTNTTASPEMIAAGKNRNRMDHFVAFFVPLAIHRKKQPTRPSPAKFRPSFDLLTGENPLSFPLCDR